MILIQMQKSNYLIRNSVSDAMPHLLTIIYFNEAAQRSFWYRDIVNVFKGKHILEDGKKMISIIENTFDGKTDFV